MAIPAKSPRVGTLSAILLCCAAATSSGAIAAAGSSPPSQVVIDQVQLGDVAANQTLHVTSAPSGVSQSTTTVGNSGVGSADHAALDYRANQELNADSRATSNVAVDNSAGDYLAVTTSATGNTGTAGTCCGALTGSATQKIDGYHTVTAQTDVSIGGPDPTGQVDVTSTAVGNTQGWETNGGSVSATSDQTHYGETYAALGATVAAVDGAATYSATAVGNNVTSDASSAPVSLTVSQADAGFRTRAGMRVDQQSGSDITAVATATSNNINVTSDGYAAALSSDQYTNNPTQAEVELNVGSWSGTVTASSYGVANSALVANSGSYTSANGVQNNSGDVSAITGFTSGSGGDAVLLSTAVGNAYSAYACPDCNGAVQANTRQINSGGVSAITNATTNSQGYVAGAASAVGNTATFQVRKQ